jgi:hypothetical protein
LRAICVEMVGQGKACPPADVPALRRLGRGADGEAAGLGLVGGLIPCGGHRRAESAEIVVSPYGVWQGMPAPL